MYHPTTGEVDESVYSKPSVPVPSPMGDDGIDDAGDHDAVDDVGDEIAALG